MDKDYYQVLGLGKSASAEEIKRAYRKLALEHHPDRNKTKEAEQKFKEINKAYEVLSDSSKKQTYDQFGHAAFEQSSYQGGNPGGPSGGPGAQGGRYGPFTYSYSTDGPFGGAQGEQGFDFGGFSDPFDIFEQFFGGASPFRRAQQKPIYSLSISFMEAALGTAKKVNISGKMQTIKIPEGVDNGSRIRFENYEVVIEVTPDQKFRREGYDVITDEDISVSQAALGEQMEVETVDGKVKIRIPSGTQPNTVIRLSGKGIKRLRGSGKGDHYVRVKVVIPKNLTGKQKELLKELDSSSKKKSWF